MDSLDVHKVVEAREEYEAINKQGKDGVKSIGNPHFVKECGPFVKEIGGETQKFPPSDEMCFHFVRFKMESCGNG